MITTDTKTTYYAEAEIAKNANWLWKTASTDNK